jgi:hypothetical protein
MADHATVTVGVSRLRSLPGSLMWLLFVIATTVLGVSCSGSVAATTTPTSTSTSTSTSTTGIATVSESGSVAILGDSITQQGESELESALGSVWDLRIDGRPGFTVADQIPAARVLAEGHPGQVIINLGTNDVLHDGNLPVAADRMEDLLSVFPDTRCIHLVTINENMGTNRMYPSRARELNASLRRLAGADPRIRLLDVSRVFANAVADPSVSKPLFSDTVHPTSSGQRVLADAYADALRSCPSG